MENNIIINKDLKFDYKDLMSNVDVSIPFTLKDIFSICENSKIPIDVLGKMLNCHYVLDLIEESKLEYNKNQDDDYSNIEYLELYFLGDQDIYDGNRTDFSHWAFHGVGIKGKIGEDVLKCCKLSDSEKIEYREKYAIELTPVYKLIDYKIYINNKMIINENIDQKIIDFRPSITLIELLFSIFYELSFCGSPKDRDMQTEKLMNVIKDFDNNCSPVISMEDVFNKIEK
jgi:hypothetical protein